MEFTFICTGKEAISMESAEYFPLHGFELRDVVGVDGDVIQVDYDNDINHIHEDVIHEPLKS